MLKITDQSEAMKVLLKITDQSEETLACPEYIRRATPDFHHSYHRISTDNMDVTDCVSSRGNMEYYENRLRTFDTCPKQMLPDKIQLARAGLYYTGKSDVCQCFRCPKNSVPGNEMTMPLKNIINGHPNVNT